MPAPPVRPAVVAIIPAEPVALGPAPAFGGAPASADCPPVPLAELPALSTGVSSPPSEEQAGENSPSTLKTAIRCLIVTLFIAHQSLCAAGVETLDQRLSRTSNR
jgi:hypothetical protein